MIRRGMRTQVLLVVLVALVSIFLTANEAAAQTRVLHLAAVQWSSTNGSHTEMTSLEAQCRDHFESEWTALESAPSPLDPDTIYNASSTLVMYPFASPVTILSFSGLDCRARATVNGVLYTQPLARNCSFVASDLINNLDTYQCCQADFDVGLSLNFCLVGRLTDGTACTHDGQCSTTGSCRGGRCCNALGDVDGCLACKSSNGACAQCSSNYFLHTSSSRRRAVSASESTLVVPFPDQPTLDFPDMNGPDLDVDNLVATQTCYLKQAPGSTCNINAHCTSGKCASGHCCNSTVATAQCTACSAGGLCTACSAGYEVVGGRCEFLLEDGDSCSADADCVSGRCTGGRCCNDDGKSLGCSACNVLGDCSMCDDGFNLISGECSRDLSDTSSSNGSSAAAVSNTAIIGIAVGCFLFVVIVVIVVQRYRISKGTAAL